MAIIGGRAHTMEELHQVGKLGYPYAEISLYVPEDVEKDIEPLLNAKKEYAISYLAHYPNEGNPLDVENLRDRFVPRMIRLFELSAMLGINKGTFHFWIDGRRIRRDVAERKIDLIADMVGAANSFGVTLCLENLSESFSDFMPAFERVSKLRMTLDIGHAQLLTENNTSFGFIDNCFDRIGHLHVHDNRGGMSVKDDLHLPLGEGVVDYPAIFTRLKEKAYESTITMEVKPDVMAGTRNAISDYLG